jgi:hypothetical protein
VLEIVGGDVRGERIAGSVLSGGADWLLINPDDGMGRLDVRMQWRMEGGALLYLSGQGVVELNEQVADAIADGEATEFEDQYYRTLMRIETGAEPYAWVNRAVFITAGRISPGSTGRGIEARVFAVT